jgi:hypothetical protein
MLARSFRDLRGCAGSGSVGTYAGSNAGRFPLACAEEFQEQAIAFFGLVVPHLVARALYQLKGHLGKQCAQPVPLRL